MEYKRYAPVTRDIQAQLIEKFKVEDEEEKEAAKKRK